MTFGSLAVLLISRLGLAILPISRLDLAVLLIIRMMPAVLQISRLCLAVLPIRKLGLVVLQKVRLTPAVLPISIHQNNSSSATKGQADPTVLPISRLIPVLCFLVLKQEGGQPVGVDRARIYKAGEFYSGGYIAHCACVVPTLSP